MPWAASLERLSHACARRQERRLRLILADGETHRGAVPVHVHPSAFAPDLSRSLYEVRRGRVIRALERELTGQYVRLTNLRVRETVHCHRCFGGRDSVDCPGAQVRQVSLPQVRRGRWKLGDAVEAARSEEHTSEL